MGLNVKMLLNVITVILSKVTSRSTNERRVRKRDKKLKESEKRCDLRRQQKIGAHSAVFLPSLYDSLTDSLISLHAHPQFI